MYAAPFWDTLVAPEDLAGAQDHVRRGIQDGAVFPQEGDWLDRSGGRHRVSTQNSVIRDARGRPVAIVTVGMDVTEQRRAEADLRERAATDLLTGLRNRAALFEALRDALTRPDAPGCGLLFADLDGFKAANDSHGHHVGDLVLVEVAARLRGVTGADDVVARLGGDEFVVLCPGVDAARLQELAARVEAALSRPVDGPHGPIAVGVSVGTALAPRGTDPDEVVRAADRQMYLAKQAHRLALPTPSGTTPPVVDPRGARFPRAGGRGARR
jgi:diguanylate cyclase (GGDEF)-like protein